MDCYLHTASDLDFLEIQKKSPISGVLDKYRKMITNGL